MGATPSQCCSPLPRNSSQQEAERGMKSDHSHTPQTMPLHQAAHTAFTNSRTCRAPKPPNCLPPSPCMTPPLHHSAHRTTFTTAFFAGLQGCSICTPCTLQDEGAREYKLVRGSAVMCIGQVRNQSLEQRPPWASFREWKRSQDQSQWNDQWMETNQPHHSPLQVHIF